MTQREVKEAINRMGMKVTRTHYGEYKVNFRDGSESTAYYTEDAADAIGTARAMRFQKDSQ